MFSGLWLKKRVFTGCQAEQLQMKDLTSIVWKTLWSTRHILRFQTLSTSFFLRKTRKRKQNKQVEHSHKMQNKGKMYGKSCEGGFMLTTGLLLLSGIWRSFFFGTNHFKRQQHCENGCEENTWALQCLCLAPFKSDTCKLKIERQSF